MPDITLIVLQHGLWGVSSHMNYIEENLHKHLKDQPFEIFNSKVNEGKYTYDGIDLCGERLAKKIQTLVNELAKEDKIVRKLSMVGYSLGGLISRYALGLLYKDGFFNTIKPVFFVTFATPHMGVRRPKTSFFSKAFNFFSGRLVSRTGEQLQLIDKFDKNLPLLCVLASPDQPYYQALEKFEIIRTYANVKNDRTVPYWTAAMTTGNYFSELEKIDIALDQDYKAIITGYDIADKSKKMKHSKKKYLWKAVFYVLAPIVFPIFALFAIIYIGSQGVISRYRVAKILNSSLAISGVSKSSPTDHPAISSRSTSSDATIDQDNENPVLSGTLDAINISANVQDPTEHLSPHRLGNWCNVIPSESLKKKYPEFKFDPCVMDIQKNLSQLPWQTVLVCIHSFNAHGSIICRQNIHTTPDGETVVRHFLDTVLD
ncbi:putative serine esterase-domain-containing protein [Halteromyces radiatus]|uniref:putative serine esterase-domain-containing protein n=1 Tax=Halteromyces radiatus TaxID=101107 RepID=UPI00222002FF|nr:putative serine esterase-domain-containing protein [Halteromyces radiatus]KAI8099407.1 putative serine esterase-domain-containing protein [Halteromyces radiatus]